MIMVTAVPQVLRNTLKHNLFPLKNNIKSNLVSFTRNVNVHLKNITFGNKSLTTLHVVA